VLQWCRRRLTRLCFVRRDATSSVFVMPVCQIEGGVKSKAVERGDAFVFPFRERAFAIAKIFSRRNFPVKSVFSKALSFLALKCPQLSFSHDSRRSGCSRAKSRDPLAVTPRVTRPIAVPPSGGARGRPFSGPRARAAARVGAAAPRPRTSAGGRLRRRRASQTPPPCPGPRRETRRTRMAGCPHPGRGSCGNSTTP
jgi:hypothetical protein